ncbi:MAG: ABC transporter permease [Lachnospiraceae bacterium]|nr:ABC transporter permease [Lachnospiraceae bacterium]
MVNIVTKYVKVAKRYRFLLGELVKKGIKLKYRRSYLGILWTLLEPIMTTIILTIVFGTWFKKDIDKFPVFILGGRLLYSFYSESTKTAMRSVRANASMIKKVYVPKYLYPVSCILYNFIIFLISLIVMVGTGIIFKVKPTLYIFVSVLPLLVLLLLAIGTSMILSTVAVFFRDMEYLWNVGLMMIMYASAIFYDPSKMEGLAGWLLKLNPLYCCIESFRLTAIYGQMFSIDKMLYATGFSLVTIVVGVYAFYKKQDQFILYI